MAVRKEAVDLFKLSPDVYVSKAPNGPGMILLIVCICRYACPFAQMWKAMVNIRKKYLIAFVRVDQAHLGEPVSRRRIYILCVRRPSIIASNRLNHLTILCNKVWITFDLFAQWTLPCESSKRMTIWRSTVGKHTSTSQKLFLRDPLCHLTLLLFWVIMVDRQTYNSACQALVFLLDSYDPQVSVYRIPIAQGQTLCFQRNAHMWVPSGITWRRRHVRRDNAEKTKKIILILPTSI